MNPTHVESSTNNAAAINGSFGRRIRRSCEACRSVKAKCCFSEENSNKCQKCTKDEKPCIFLEAKSRAKLAKTSKARVVELEGKVESLLALLQPGQTEESEPISTRNINAISFQPHQETPYFPVPSLFPKPCAEGPATARFPAFSFPAFESFDDVISRGIISLEQAAGCLQDYQGKCINYPFVIVPRRTTVESLRRRRPFLLLAIVAMGSSANAKLQQQLDHELKETLARKLIVNSEKNLDLLQGVLVYLAWYHFFFHPMQEMVHRLAQIAASMACDLGLHKNKWGTPLNGVTYTPYIALLSSDELESRRAFLGCYYLTSWIALGLRKPGTLKYTAYVAECTQSLAQAGEEETDYLLPYFIRFQHLADDIYTTFGYDEDIDSSRSNCVRIGILLKGFEQRLDLYQSSAPPEIWKNVSLSFSIHGVRVFMHEVCFHAVPVTWDDSTPLDTESWYASTARTESIIRGVQASQRFIECALSLSCQAYMDYTFVEFGRIMYAVLILGAFATRCSTPMLSTEQIRELADFDNYLDALLLKTMNAITELCSEGANAYLKHKNTLLSKVKAQYTYLVKNAHCKAGGTVGGFELSFVDIMSAIKEQYTEIEAGPAVMSEGGPDAGWMDMSGGWSVPSLEQEGSMNEPQI